MRFKIDKIVRALTVARVIRIRHIGLVGELYVNSFAMRRLMP